MGRILHAAEAVSRLGAYVGCTLLILSAALVGVEVVARKVFHVSMQGADEITGYALAISSAWAFSYALFTRSHVRVDAIYTLMPARARVALDIISLTSFAALATMITWRGWEVVQETLRLDAHSSTPLRTPMIVPQSLWLAGIVFFLICILILLAATISAVVRGDLVEARRLAGAPSVQDEVDEEVNAAIDPAAIPASARPGHQLS